MVPCDECIFYNASCWGSQDMLSLELGKLYKEAPRPWRCRHAVVAMTRPAPNQLQKLCISTAGASEEFMHLINAN